jgi:hypothetical protein
MKVLNGLRKVFKIGLAAKSRKNTVFKYFTDNFNEENYSFLCREAMGLLWSKQHC